MHGFNYREPQIPRSRFNEPGRFGRMFPWLRGLKTFDPGADELGKVGGAMDGGNPPSSAPRLLNLIPSMVWGLRCSPISMIRPNQGIC